MIIYNKENIYWLFYQPIKNIMLKRTKYSKRLISILPGLLYPTFSTLMPRRRKPEHTLKYVRISYDEKASLYV
jgi:hypothetical protein